MPPALNPIQRFQSSKHRKVWEDFLKSETGAALLSVLPHFYPAAHTALNTSVHGAQATLADVRADTCAQIIGFERCNRALLQLTELPPQQKPQMPEPSYTGDVLGEIKSVEGKRL